MLSNTQDPRLAGLFRGEVASVARLHHPNLITIYELGEHAGLPFAALQDLDGRDLRTVMAEAPLTLLQKVTIMWQVAEGLRAAYQGSLSCVRVRPSGITLTNDRSAVIQDFGIVRLIGEEHDEDLSYSAPEELQSDVVPDKLSDIYSYGAIYYDLLTGVYPPRGGIRPEVRDIAPESPDALARLVHRALEQNREQRFQTIDAVQDEAEPILC